MLYIYSKLKYKIALALLMVFTAACWVQASTAEAISRGYCLETIYGNAPLSAAPFVRDNDMKYVWDTYEKITGYNVVSSELLELTLLWGDWQYGSTNGGIKVKGWLNRANGSHVVVYFYCEKATSAHVFTDWPEHAPDRYGVYNGF